MTSVTRAPEAGGGAVSPGGEELSQRPGWEGGGEWAQRPGPGCHVSSEASAAGCDHGGGILCKESPCSPPSTRLESRLIRKLLEDQGASHVASGVKNPPAKAGDLRATSSILGWGSSPRGGPGNPLQCSCLENPTDRGAWRATAQD